MFQPFLSLSKYFFVMNSSKKSAACFLGALFIAAACIQSCNSNKKNMLFESLPASKTNITFSNKLEQKKLFNILYYLYYYNGAGVAAGDINNDGLQDIYFAANSKGNNKLYLNKGNFEFEDITAKANVAGTADWCTGVTMADVNNDGYQDIYVSTVSSKYGLKGHNELFINNQNNTFTESAEAYGLNTSCITTQTAFFDYDRDGDLDCYILNQSDHPHANIIDISNRKRYDTLSGDRLYRNDLNTPAKKFTEVSKQAGIYQSNLGYGLGIAVADINNDGWDDIYVGNDFHENDYYYVNNGNGTFTESGANHFSHYSRFSMGNDVADYNNDGQLDIITVDMLPPDEKALKTYGSDENPDTYKLKLQSKGYQNQNSKNCLQRNNGNGVSFSETALQSGVSATDWSWCPLFADFDNDGNKDLFVSSGIVKRPVDLDFIRFASKQQARGIDMTDKYDNETIAAMPDGNSHPFLFKGDGKLSFKDVSDSWGTQNLKGCSNGAAYADLDNDGKLDLIINCLDAPAIILKNNAPNKNYISVSFKSDSINTAGVGCKTYLFAGGKMQYQQCMQERGFMSSSSAQLHFGLDSVNRIDSLLIVWPNQKYELIKNPAINKILVVNRKDAHEDFIYEHFFPSKKELFQDVSTQVNSNWRHKENDFLDYNVQYLIPHQLSSRGPKLAVADVNNDGLDDMYACGAKGQPGALMLQLVDGSFVNADTAVFNKDAACEDVDAVFFDADNDGDNDLYVADGGNEYLKNNPFLQDRLYVNDGKGHFTKSVTALPQILENKSCISVADIDNDKDMDIFIGTLADARTYGLPQTSHLLINDGKGKFSVATGIPINLQNIGMVTASSFADINKDGWQDLIITGEWMPVKIFINNKGVFTAEDVPASTGLWQTVYITDVNEDGFTDILAGNWGHNTKLWAGKNGPLKLYVKDFDKNGSVEQIMCYTIAGKEYTFLAKDELERSLPVLKKAYLTYSEVAGETVQYMFYDLFKDYTELKAEVLSSSCFINDGRGNFSRIDLPEELQLAPIMAFQKTAKQQYIAGGNFFDVVPYEGRYDAQPLAMFSIKGNKEVSVIPQSNLTAVQGQVRDIKLINNNTTMLVARNNERLLIFKKK